MLEIIVKSTTRDIPMDRVIQLIKEFNDSEFILTVSWRLFMITHLNHTKNVFLDSELLFAEINTSIELIGLDIFTGYEDPEGGIQIFVSCIPAGRRLLHALCLTSLAVCKIAGGPIIDDRGIFRSKRLMSFEEVLSVAKSTEFLQSFD